MSFEIFIKKENNLLVPADKSSEERLEDLKSGQWYKAKIYKPRNVKFHRKFFALLNAVIEQSDYFTGKSGSMAIEELKERIKIKTGHYNITSEVDIEGLGKVPILKTRSIAFDKMDNITFEAFYNTALHILRTDKDLGVEDLVFE